MTTANVNITKVLMKRGNTAQNAAYTGVNGEVVVDLQAKTLRIHDGSTVGGFVITASGVVGGYSNTNTAAYLDSQNITSANIGAFQTYANATFSTSSYANANVKSYLGSFDGNILPSANVTYSLGDATHQWKDLWVSNNTIYIGNTPIRVDGGTLLVNNSPITGVGNVSSLVNGSATFSLNSSGTLTLPGGASFVTYDQTGAVDLAANVATDSYIGLTYANRNWMYVDDNGAYIWASDGANLKTWTFGLNGNLRLPTNGMITYANGQNILSGITGGGGAVNTGNLLFEGTTIYFDASKATTPDTVLNISPNVEGWAYLQLPNDTSAAVANVRLHNDAGNIEIATGDFSNFGPLYSWYFKNDGSLELPQVTAITTQAVIRSGGNIVINANDTGQWKFDTDGILTIPSGGKLGSLQPEAGTGIDLYADGTMSYAQVNYNNTNYIYTDAVGAQLQTPNVYITAATLTKRATIQAVDPDTASDSTWIFNANGTLVVPGLIEHTTGTSQVSLTENGFRFESNVGTNSTYIDGQQNALFLLGGTDGTVVGAGPSTWNFDAAGNLTLSTTGNIVNGGNVWTFGSDGNLTLPGIDNPANRAGTILNVKGIVGTTSSSGANISGFAVVSAATIRAGSYQYSNGVSILDGIGGTYSNANVASYLTDYTGNIGAGNVNVGRTQITSGVITTSDGGAIAIRPRVNFLTDDGIYVTGVVFAGGGFYALGYYWAGNNVSIFDGINASINTRAPAASPTFTGTLTSSGNIAAQANVTVNNNMTVLGNLSVQGTTTTINSQTLSITDKFITVANNSTNSSEANGAGIYVPGSAANILYTSINDSWTLNKSVVSTGNIKATSWVTGNVFAYANNVNILSDLNSNAATQATAINTINANVGAYQTWANINFSTSTYSNTNVEAYIGGNIGAYQTFANANAATQSTSINTINANIGAYQIFANTNAAAQATSLNSINANIGAYQTYANANVVAIQANLGAFQTFSNSNSATQATSINTINANLGAFQTYANTTFGTSSYGNANVATYLPTYTGNLQAANITTLGTYGNITGANVISANTFVFGANGVNILTAIGGSGSSLTNGGYSLALQSNGVVTLGSGATISNDGSEFRFWSTNGVSVYYNGMTGFGAFDGYVPVYADNTQIAEFTTNGLEVKNGNIVIPNNKGIFYANGAAYSSGAGAVSSLTNNGYIVALGSDGVLTTAGTIKTNLINNVSPGQRITIDPDNSNLAYFRADGFDDGSERVVISNQFTNSLGVYFYTEGGYSFRMYQNQFKFADDTWQTTAWTGTVANLTNNGYTVALGSDGSTTFPDHKPVSITGNLTVGNLFVTGNSTVINTENYVVSDNIIQMANANPADVLDLGFVAHRTVSGNLQHTGLVRDASAGNWKLFSNVLPQPGNTVDFTNAVYDDLIAGNVTGIDFKFANGVSILSTVAPSSTYSNVNVEAYIGGNIGAFQIFSNANSASQQTSINSINANLGAYQTFANANVSSIQNQIFASNANIGAFQTYANATFGVSSYANTDVAGYLAANSAIYLGNPVARYPNQANVAQAFVGNTTTIAAGGGASLGITYLLNNLYFGSNGTQYYRNTQTGAAQLSISGAGGFSFAGTTGAVTANAVQGLGSWATLSSTGFSTFNSLGITSAGTLAVNGSGGITTTQTTFPLVNATATTINFGGAATLLTIGATTGNVAVGSGVGTLTAGNVNASTVAVTNFSAANAVINGGYIANTANITVTSGGNIAGVGNIIGSTANTTISAGAYTTSFLSNGVMITSNVIQTASYYETYSNISNTGGNITFNFANSSVFYATLTANVTANVIGIANSLSTVTGFTVIIDQGATPYRIANIQFNGGAVNNIKWAGTTVPTGTASNTDIVSISLINLGNGNYRILGQQSSYG